MTRPLIQDDLFGGRAAAVSAEPAPPAEPGVVYVDEPAAYGGRSGRWCHMASEDVEALHRMAGRLGLGRGAFQRPPHASWPHYDLTEARRLAALRAGAIAVTRREMTAIRERCRAAWDAQTAAARGPNLFGGQRRDER